MELPAIPQLPAYGRVAEDFPQSRELPQIMNVLNKSTKRPGQLNRTYRT